VDESQQYSAAEMERVIKKLPVLFWGVDWKARKDRVGCSTQLDWL